MTMSSELNAMFDDPNKDETAFYQLLKRYVASIANGLVANRLIEDLTGDVLFQIVRSMDSFTHRPEHNGSSFSRWICGLVYNRAGNLKREFYGARETPISNVGTFLDGEKWEPADLSALAPSLTDEEFDESLSVEAWPMLANDTLEHLRASIPARDIPLFGAIRTSGNIKTSADSVGMKSSTAYSRVRRWFKFTKDPGARPTAKCGAPPSNAPDERLAIACILQNPVAMIIRDSWRFSRPVVSLPAESYDEIVSRGYQVITA